MRSLDQRGRLRVAGLRTTVAAWLAAVCLPAVLAMALASPAQAQALAGVPEVRSAFVSLVDGVYQLNADIHYPATEATADALRDGVTLTYDLELNVSRERRWWLDAQVVAVGLRRELSYHSVSERYVVRDLQPEAERSFATLDEALADLGKVQTWPVLVAAQVPPGECFVNLRAMVRRGRLNDTLRVLMFWSDDWQLGSEWFTWSLPR
ncbi:MAG: DUF4390 domain-containing protein [Gammaproteobacteria bacterium]